MDKKLKKIESTDFCKKHKENFLSNWLTVLHVISSYDTKRINTAFDFVFKCITEQTGSDQIIFCENYNSRNHRHFYWIEKREKTNPMLCPHCKKCIDANFGHNEKTYENFFENEEENDE